MNQSISGKVVESGYDDLLNHQLVIRPDRGELHRAGKHLLGQRVVVTAESAALPTIFASADIALARSIAAGELPKGIVLSVLMVLRDAATATNHDLAERLVPTQCERATEGSRS